MTDLWQQVRRPWVLTLISGLVLWLVLHTALLETQNLNLVPAAVIGFSLLAWRIYAAERPTMVRGITAGSAAPSGA